MKTTINNHKFITILKYSLILLTLCCTTLSLSAANGSRGVKGSIIGPNGQPYRGPITITLIKKLKNGQSSTTASLRGPTFKHTFKGFDAYKWDYPFLVKVHTGSDGELTGEAWVTDPGGPASYDKTAWVEIILSPRRRY